MSKMYDLEGQLLEIPHGSEYHANRYDDDNTMKLHVWDDKGNSYDIEKPKLDEILLGHSLNGKGILERGYDKLLDNLGEEIKKVIMNKIHCLLEDDIRIIVLKVPRKQPQ